MAPSNPRPQIFINDIPCELCDAGRDNLRVTKSNGRATVTAVLSSRPAIVAPCRARVAIICGDDSFTSEMDVTSVEESIEFRAAATRIQTNDGCIRYHDSPDAFFTTYTLTATTPR